MILLVGVGPKSRPHEFVSGILIRTNAHASIPSEFAPFAAMDHGLTVWRVAESFDSLIPEGMVKDSRDEDPNGSNLSPTRNVKPQVYDIHIMHTYRVLHLKLTRSQMPWDGYNKCHGLPSS